MLTCSNIFRRQQLPVYPEMFDEGEVCTTIGVTYIFFIIKHNQATIKAQMWLLCVTVLVLVSGLSAGW